MLPFRNGRPGSCGRIICSLSIFVRAGLAFLSISLALEAALAPEHDADRGRGSAKFNEHSAANRTRSEGPDSARLRCGGTFAREIRSGGRETPRRIPYRFSFVENQDLHTGK